MIVKYLRVKLTGGTVDKMVASIQSKSAALGEIEQSFAQVTRTGDAYWGAAAYNQVGLAYEQLGDMLTNPPTIKGAKIEDVKKELAPQAKLAYDKAMEYYREGYKTARKFGVYSDYTIKLSSAIARRSGSKLSFNDWILMPDFLGSEVTSRVRNTVQ